MRNLSTSVKAIIALVAAVVGLAVLKFVAAWVALHWLLLVVIVATLVAVSLGAFAFRRHQTSDHRAEYAELERHLSRADEMTIPQFESWVGQLLLRDGFRKIRFMGRSGDFGSNFVATAPDARRVVVRAKPDDGTLSKRGARHIQALGADAHAKWQADTAILVTNADLHPLKTAARHDALAEQLGVILIDRLELATWVADRRPPAELTATPAAAG
ncbi:MAG TPA: restriction endonuclease [Stackebrandtia sp.]|uniref:restriction endonuclease n=1 Tax=Stackebrandtia sp. TaxID=2023065 RepID=UPI002D23ECC1|nr:restriction endonuclease [Stackebrandtia sp.]HZE41695.1 restriction endonuclease [Stackebrandtia sp.]